MPKIKHIAVVGAGIVGLSSALWLQRAGFKVTIIDPMEPGAATSYGNAGVLAGFARLPFTRFSMLCKIPGMLIDKDSPLSLARHYVPELIPYGWNYFKSCFRYKKMRHALTELQSKAWEADQVLLNESGGHSLIRSEGSLGLFSSQSGIEKAKKGEILERQGQGVNIELFDPAMIREMEPSLEPFYAGGIYYPDTRFTISPIELSRCYTRHFLDNGGCIVREKVNFINPDDQGIEVQTSLQRLQFDHLVIAAGVASKHLAAQLGVKVPLVNERGYHLSIEKEGKSLSRPIAWLENAVFLAPINNGIRLAGTAEFADENAPPNRERINCMKRHAHTMLGDNLDFTSKWVGSRPSTPDSLPVIGSLLNDQRITLAFGHGHLGLTLSAITGQLVSEIVQGQKPSVDLESFSPYRFS
ncbi:FAD-dependent oxidoreductase [Amphritea sp. 1_MG-2023]|uniref:NAD(P)/FAD-dependent oxidoreductase n=1 Tax=Amphritea sp. 1_MG-2023 TaxID=3062670 RepID=UPI0026E46C57|nr:FAD-dependent oxidoreductase [Amphritea sp. 1_MG-2023]MDO6565392.1 FAD-dependent oxidoreductase [Amphritea sp. 1_MG-2023]